MPGYQSQMARTWIWPTLSQAGKTVVLVWVLVANGIHMPSTN